MKLNPIFKMPGACRALLVAATALFSAGALRAQGNFFAGTAPVNLGAASGDAAGSHKNWAIFALSGGVTITDPSGGGSADVYGNIGMAGSGYLNMSVASVNGSVYDVNGSNNAAAVLSGGAHIDPSGVYAPGASTSDLNNAVSAANSASTTAAGLTVTPGTATTFVQTSGTANNLSLGLPSTGAANTTYVVNLANLILSNSILTLSGTSTTDYVFNVAQYMTLASNAHINLTGGLSAANVLFNVKSYTTQYDVTLGGGSKVNGIILAPARNVKMTGGSEADGEVIAKAVSLSGASKVINPFVSP